MESLHFLTELYSAVFEMVDLWDMNYEAISCNHSPFCGFLPHLAIGF